MIEWFAEYGLFLAKSLTIVAALLMAVAGILAIAMREKDDNGTLIISSINEKYDDIKDSLQLQTLNKHEQKVWQKEQKKAKKQAVKKSKKSKKTNIKQESSNPEQPRIFVIKFEGDIRASEVTNLREIISAIITIQRPRDEVLVILESAGGFVHSYGLAASQLNRLKEHKIKLTVAIDKVAASGGYMMACVADQIIAAPFAIVGSIGVIAQLPNFNKFLQKHNIDFEQHTAGEFKRTLTMFGKNTDKAREKFIEDLEQTHVLFKDYITEHRAQVDLSKAATGEHWHAIQAKDMNLIDIIKTSDDFILDKLNSHKLYEISYEEKHKLSEKISGFLTKIYSKVIYG